MKTAKDFKSQYFSLYQSAVQAIESYDLTEDSYNNIISILEEMENLLIQEGSKKKSSEEQRIVDQ
jgi:predicted choloylglycine hydrolase